MKKKFLTISLISSSFLFSFASDFNIIIHSDEAKYDSRTFSDVISFSEWNTNIHSCSPQLDIDNYYYNKSFNQVNNCTQSETRTETKTRTYSNGEQDIVYVKTESKDTQIQENSTSLGTHLESSCNNIIKNNYSNGDDKYFLSGGGTPFEVYCDMTTDGGGWTYFSGGKITNTTTDDEFINFYTKYNEFKDLNQLYGTDRELRKTVSFKEFREYHIGEANKYENHVTLNKDVTTATSYSELRNYDVESYKIKNSINGDYNQYEYKDCQIGLNNTSAHFWCDGQEETQNPWYQSNKINVMGAFYGIHTCIRLAMKDGVNLTTCSEKVFSPDMFEGECQGDEHWKNELTDSKCNFRKNTNSFYQWQEWVR